MEALVGLVGLGLAAPGLVDVVVRAGRAIEARVSQARHIEEQLVKYQTFGIDLSRGLLFTQLELVSSALRSDTIREELKVQLDGCFKKMVECLIAAETELKVIESSTIKGKLKILFGRKLGLESKLQELDKQRDIFASLASFIHFQHSVPSPSLLGSRVKLRHESKHKQAGDTLRTSDICVAECDMGGGVVKNVVVERRLYTAQSKDALEEDIKSLTRNLQLAASSQTILKCLGYRKNPFLDAYDIIFELPTNPHRRSLADMLSFDKTPTLSHRVALCKQIAHAVSDVHSIGLVHKSIRPHNVLVIGQYHEKKSSQPTFLTDWTLVRKVEQPSFWIGEDDWQRAIYQHPSRQGLRAESEYTIRHDIYSLGICMLEVLLWQPFIVSSDLRSKDSPKAISEHFQTRAIELGLDRGIDKRYFGDTRKMTSKPSVVCRVMVDLCRTELPACVGNKLSEVVLNCLCCLDDEAKDEKDASDDDTLVSGLSYIGDVLVALGTISI
ncbi:hypothetical protein BDW02DRAFT_575118 [Decorospora gaudefroyi]|uniref:Protein kinase domain-containing protein n=1 Tax=Decorospora gaudefroyi TaxID=184978 RepID=A0A6A5K405_9PLEO|nr:hypothetical protein BDW02DRAFT_575118 [Decorospora gaudefroyi]